VWPQGTQQHVDRDTWSSWQIHKHPQDFSPHCIDITHSQQREAFLFPHPSTTTSCFCTFETTYLEELPECKANTAFKCTAMDKRECKAQLGRFRATASLHHCTILLPSSSVFCKMSKRPHIQLNTYVIWPCTNTSSTSKHENYIGSPNCPVQWMRVGCRRALYISHLHRTFTAR
jgi:hypothetical protein